MSKEALQKAIDNLHIRDVYLRSLHSDCEEGFDPKYADLSALLFQTRHFVKKSEVVGIDGDCRLLRVFIDLGARWVEEKGADDVVVKAFIEAEFV
ncbi:MAG: preprotein translocase subunit SecB, partial [Deltaproteobacteria bacterium]